MNQDPTLHPNSIPALLRELRDETTTLFRQEAALAKTEIKDNVSHVVGKAVQIAIGGFIAYAGLIVLLIGLGHLIGIWLVEAGVSDGVAVWAAPAGLGLLVALIGGIMLASAKRALAQADLKPHQTIESLRTDKEFARSKLRHSL